MLAERSAAEITLAEKVDALESIMLDAPQESCPVAHYFGPGIYIREVFLPAGIVVIGHNHRSPHMNIMTHGEMILAMDGTVQHIEAPQILTAQPGRKVAFIVKPCVWQNIYPNPDDERDIDVLESRYMVKSEEFKRSEDIDMIEAFAAHTADRADFAKLLKDFDLEEMPLPTYSDAPNGMGLKATVRTSPIQGKGIFVTAPIAAGEVVGPLIWEGEATQIGRFINHSMNPNCHILTGELGCIYAVALRPINGCMGGGRGEEATINYRSILSESGFMGQEASKCQA